jgi:hypothetical protein
MTRSVCSTLAQLRSVCLTLAAAGWAAACAAPSAEQATTVPQATAQSGRVATLAPDLAARAERARRAAAEQSTPDARRDALRRAGLLEEAAAAEADRVELEREFEQVEQRMAEAEAQRAAAQRARLQAERERVLAESAERERADAEQVFRALQEPEASSKPRSPADSERIASFLTRRAQTRLAAAIALGGLGPERSAAETQLAAALAAGAAARAKARIALARAALLAAERALGAARAQSAQTNALQTRDLLARARERGFSAESSTRGVLIHLATPFSAGHAEPRSDLRARLQLLSELLSAFPAGPIRIVCQAGAASGPELALARARTARVLELFAQTSERTRLIADEPAAASPELQLNLPAYFEVASSSDPGQ